MLYVLFSNADLSFMVTVRQLRTSAIRFRIDIPAHSQQYWYESAYSNFSLLFIFYLLCPLQHCLCLAHLPVVTVLSHFLNYKR